MKKRLSFLIIYFCFIAEIFAQVPASYLMPGSLRFEKVPDINGAVDIVQDQQGFMWFAGGSDDGLYRFDGYEVKRYRNIPGDETSLADNWVESVLVDRKGRLWVGTFSEGGSAGFHLYNTSTDTFKRYLHNPTDPNSLSNNRISVLLEDREGIIWIGTMGGLNQFNPETVTFTRYVHNFDDPTSLSSNRIRALYEDSFGDLWIGTSDASLNRFNRETGTFTRFQHIPGDKNSLSNDGPVRALLEDSKGNFWVGTGEDGLHTMDRETGTFTHYPYDPDRTDQPHMPQLQHGPFIMVPITVQFKGLSYVYEDRHDKLWIGGFGGGIDVYDPHTGLVNHYEANPDDPSSRDLNLTWTIYESSDGTIWIGTWSGLFKAVPSLTGFSFYQPDSSNPDSLTNGNVWMLSESQDSLIYVPTRGGGLNVFNPKTGSFSAIQHDADDPTSLGSDDVLYAIDDHTGALWIGTADGGLNRQLDPELGTFKQYRHDPEDSLSLSSSNAYPFEDGNGTIWVVSGGLNRLMDPVAGTFQRYMHDPDDPFSLSSNSVRGWYEDSEGNLWIGTASGLNLYNRADDTFTRFLPGVHIRSIYEDKTGRFWIGTVGIGLVRFDRITGNSWRFTSEDGLPSNSVASIVEDDKGILWLSMFEGSYQSPDVGYVTRFDPESESFMSFGTEDGLPDIGFTSESALRRSDGKIMFGGRGGLLTIDPEVFAVDVSRTAPLVTLIELRIHNEVIVPGTESTLSQPIYLTDEIVLYYRQNDFTIDYAGLLYRNPGEIRYRHILENYDRDWVDARTTRSARYSGLAPGEYLFRVRAVSGNSIWSEEDAVLAITILPPWWRTGWAYVLWGFLFFGIVFGVYRLLHAFIVRKERERSQIRETELRAEAAELQARALEAENERNRIEVEKARELEKAYNKLQTTQAQLIQSEKMASLGQLTAGIAHEIKNPLNFVNNFAEVNEELAHEMKQALAANKSKRIEEVIEDLDEIASGLSINSKHISKHGKRADSIVNSMMEHARAGGGQRLHVGLNPFVEENISLSHNSMLAQHPDLEVEIERVLDDAIGTVEISPQEMGRALINVLNNAFDAVIRKKETAGGAFWPQVRVVTKKVDTGVEIRIEDNGPGIPEKIREKIFEPFFTTKPTGSGTGLGLSLAYDIVTQGHGGKMVVESVEGKGATFVITLPG